MADRVLKRIEDTLNSGSFYEAQQMYKTIYHRYSAKGMHAESRRVLEEGASLLFKKKQVTSAADLGILLVEAYDKEEGLVPGQAEFDQVDRVLQNLPSSSTVSSEADSAQTSECLRFINKAIKWAQKVGGVPAAKRFHLRAGAFLWMWHGWKRLAEVILHHTRAQDWAGVAKVLSVCGELCPTSEEEMLVTRGVLQVVAWSHKDQENEHISGAKSVMDTYMKLRDGGPLDSPLIHFSSFLLQALEVRSKDLVTLLSSRYAPSLNRDPNLNVWVARVEGRFFGEPNGGGLMGNLLRMLGPQPQQS
ncbi:hypothetical protein BSKO_07655 [Bryopsis sp. KO-2023]|nr:hypothetical protein BSKO_07655 [Bryopsis sp. KO-2023]